MGATYVRPYFLALSVRLKSARVYVPSMSDLHDCNQKLIISDFINNAISDLAGSIFFLAGQLLTAGTARVIRQRVEAFQNASDILLRDLPKILGY